MCACAIELFNPASVQILDDSFWIKAFFSLRLDRFSEERGEGWGSKYFTELPTLVVSVHLKWGLQLQDVDVNKFILIFTVLTNLF